MLSNTYVIHKIQCPKYLFDLTHNLIVNIELEMYSFSKIAIFIKHN